MSNDFVPLPVPYPEKMHPVGLLLAIGRHSFIGRAGSGAPFFPETPFPGEEALLIGHWHDLPCYAVDADDELPEPPGCRRIAIRDAIHDFAPGARAAFARARELLNWRARHRFCGACGSENFFSDREIAAVCPACAMQYFPEIAPAVIVAIRRDGRLLLAHNRNFQPGLYSLIAGFVEAGEDLEEAVAREVAEEVGIAVTNIRYFGSQSWPFPSAMMLGFTADYLSGEITPDGEEITEADFFAPGEFPAIPSPGSISRALIDDFLRAHGQ